MTTVLLELDLTGALAAAPPPDLLGRLQAARTPTLSGVVRALADAAEDPDVHGLVAKLGGAGRLRLAQAQELAEAVRSFRAAGKRTWAWAETFGEGGPGTPPYVLAAAFDEVWLQPSGDVGLTGVAVEAVFLRGLLDKAGVEPQLGQRREYKNAADVLLRTGFTDAHREASQALADSAQEQVVAAVASGRALAADAVRAVVDRAPVPAADAGSAGLVDRIGYRHEVYAAARRHAGGDVALRYLTAYRRRRPPVDVVRSRWERRRQGVVALVHAVGEIRLGRSGRSLRGPALGSDTLTAALRAAGRDESVRAVVLRVDSPGGSYVASDAMWAEVGALRAGGTPVVVSMGALAASGGYFIACGADHVVSLPSTLTGSIGVLGGKPVIAELLARAGIGTDAAFAGRHARISSVRTPYTDEEWQHLQDVLDRIYADFVGKVAAGRGMTTEQVDEVARGRVWTGADALRHGLVDELGGLRRAAEVARSRAGLPADAALRPYPHIPLVRQLRRPRSSEDPAAAAQVDVAALSPLGATGRAGLLGALGVGPGTELLMPPVRI
jgi:protease IV